MRIGIKRAEGGRLVIDDAEVLAVEFFENDDSSARDESFDERARRTDPSEPFTQEDAHAIREGMRLQRLDRNIWPWLVNESPKGFLDNIDPTWDLADLDLGDWNDIRPVVTRALYDFMGAGRGAPVATKFLHYKRRLLFPILDSAVLAMTGLRIPEPTTSKRPDTIERSRRNRADAAADACWRMRGYVGHNIDVISEIQKTLRDRGKDRSRIRILDALVWSVHPASEPSRSGTIHWSRS